MRYYAGSGVDPNRVTPIRHRLNSDPAAAIPTQIETPPGETAIGD